MLGMFMERYGGLDCDLFLVLARRYSSVKDTTRWNIIRAVLSNDVNFIHIRVTHNVLCEL